MENLISWWQELPYHISPILFLRSLQLRYYGMMYLVAFLVTYTLISHRLKHENFNYSTETIQDLFLWALPDSLSGAPGYVLFYNPVYYLRNLWRSCCRLIFLKACALSESAACPIMAAPWVCLLPFSSSAVKRE